MPCHNMLMEKKKKYEKMKKLKKAREETLANKKEQSKFDDIPRLGNGGKDDITLEIALKGTESKNNSSITFDPTKSENKEVASAQKVLSPQQTKASITQPEGNLLKSDDKPNILSKPPTYQKEANSSISTFDVDDYAESSNDAKDELGSSLYSKTSDANSSRDSDIKNSLAGGIEKIDSSPIEKLDVVLDYNITSPNTEKLQSTAVFKDVTEPVNIPTLNPNSQNDDGFSYLYQEQRNTQRDRRMV